jgi:ABC-type cobalamin/Fe3+-siderophores transport system ATPase subunit
MNSTSTHLSPAELAAQCINQTNKSVFLTGKAGTGKTTFLRSVIEHTHKNAIIVAPTGIAAINAGGVTIHSQFQLPFGMFVPDNNAQSNNPFVKIKHFNQGKSLLEKIIRENPTKAEWIYYRFVIQSNTPSILNYKKNLNEDRIFLEKILQQNEIDSDLKNRIVIVLNQKPKEHK